MSLGAVVRSIFTRFGFQVDKGKLVSMNAQIGRSKRELYLATRGVQRITSGFNTMAMAAKAAFAAVAGSRIFNFLTKGYADSADEAAKQSKAVGITIEQYQELGHASKLAGADIGVVSTGLQRMAKTARTALQGSKTAVLAFKDVGIDPRNKELMHDQYGLLLRIADAFQGMEDGQRKTALAQELLGKSGARLIPLLNEGSAGIRKYAREAHELGIVIGPKAAKQAEEYNDQWLRVKSAFLGVRNTLARQLLPTFTRWFRQFQQWFREGGNAAQVTLWLKRALGLAGVALAGFVTLKSVKMIKFFTDTIWGADKATRKLALSTMWAQAKVLLWAVIIGFLVVAIEDLYRFAKGDRSLIGEWLGDTKDAADLRSILLSLGAALKELWKELKPALRSLWQELKKALPPIWEAFKPLIPYLKDMVIWALKGAAFIATAFATVVSWVVRMREKFGEAYNIVTWILNPIGKLLGLIRETATSVTFLGKAIRLIGKAWDAVKGAVITAGKAVESAWKAVFGWIEHKIRWIIDKVMWAADKLGIIDLGGGFFGGELLKGLQPAMAGGAAGTMAPMIPSMSIPAMPGPGALAAALASRAIASGTVQNIDNRRNANVAAVNVHIAGSLNMDSADVQEKMKTAGREALTDALEEVFADYKEPA